MIPERRDLPEPQPVWATDGEGTWPGWLSSWARWDDAGWQGYCWWSRGMGQTHMGHVLADRLQPREVES